MTKHNFFLHAFVAVVLFVISYFLFGGGIYSAVLLTTAEVSGTLMGVGNDFSQDADRIYGLVPTIVAIIVNIVLYYFAAIIILATFGMLKK